MPEMFDLFFNAIKKYCDENNLDYDKILKSPKCGNKDALFIQHCNPEIGKLGLQNEHPAEVLLSARKEKDGTITIMQYKNANRYLTKEP